ncbi:MAG TPA: phosphoenolpyruvate--protein phosphotransferase [Frankiaceae bacterium]
MADTLTGLGVSPGVAHGAVVRMSPPPLIPADLVPRGTPAAEAADAQRALDAVGDFLDRKAVAVGGAAAEVLQAQAMMARDPSLTDAVVLATEAGRPAAHALVAAFDGFRAILAAAGPYLAERVADLDDLRNRAVALVLGLPVPGVPAPGHPFVLVAADLAPADTAGLDPTQVLALVTEGGGPTSHTAILAKSLGLPAVVSCPGAAALADGETVLVDGGAGTVVVSPEPAAAERALAAERARREVFARSSGPGRTADGHRVQLLVNVGADSGIAAAAAVDAEGVGLFRTEFLFLDRPEEPTRVEQEAAYRAVFEAFAGRKVVVRTLDAGADKPLAFITVPDEPNPALGVRGLRTARRMPELLDRQLASLAAAAQATTADVWVMAPMVSTPAEAAAFGDRVRAAGLSVAGSMVEVPAAALRAQQVLAVCDFVSLGTNDLAQYTFAADRMVGELAELLDPWQPALLELVRLTARAGQDHGKPVGVCGEAASDPLLAAVLVGLGVTSLSMAPGAVAEVRATLAGLSLAVCQELAALALHAADGRAAQAAVAERVAVLS